MQAADLQSPEREPPGLDLKPSECDALVDFVAALPPPREQVTRNSLATVEVGRQVFDRIGCAACHLPELDGVKGIYSDLLLHPMGHQLDGQASGGGYGAFVATKSSAEPKCNFGCGCFGFGDEPSSALPAFECRTPPLWGVASSAPYLHDGRAATLSDAILLHAGQGEAAAKAFRALDETARQSLLAFLGSLVAPQPEDVIAPDDRPSKRPIAGSESRDDTLAGSFKPRHPPGKSRK